MPICDMLKIPRHKIIHRMGSGDSYVQGITRELFGYGFTVNKFVGKFQFLLRHVQFWNPDKCVNSSLRCFGIATPDFLCHHRRRKQIKPLCGSCPPLTRHYLPP